MPARRRRRQARTRARRTIAPCYTGMGCNALLEWELGPILRAGALLPNLGVEIGLEKVVDLVRDAVLGRAVRWVQMTHDAPV